MDVDIPADTSITGHESLIGPSSTGSYNDNVVAQTDSASVTSTSLTLPQSPARSTMSVQSSPATAPPMPNAPPTTPPANPFDLLDANGAYGQSYPTSRQLAGGGGFVSSDDDHTEPSSSATGITAENPPGYTRSDENVSAISTFGRLIENTKKRLNPGERRRPEGESDDEDNDSDEEETVLKSALIYGYLKKWGRNGKWQTRWFETDGECLTYYKSSKRIKLLATLDLAKVGSIQINEEDENGTTFTIHISERPYRLMADSKAACKDWVITLNRVKEARMQEGNVKLVMPTSQPPDLLDQDFAPRVVVVANRQRTRAIDTEELQSWENGPAWNPNPATGSETRASSSGRLARWQKPRNSLSRLASRLARWARSIRKYGCTDADNHVVLDHHLHPPGHDDQEPTKPEVRSETGSKDVGMPELPSGRGKAIHVNVASQISPEDDEVRHLS